MINRVRMMDRFKWTPDVVNNLTQADMTYIIGTLNAENKIGRIKRK